MLTGEAVLEEALEEQLLGQILVCAGSQDPTQPPRGDGIQFLLHPQGPPTQDHRLGLTWQRLETGLMIYKLPFVASLCAQHVTCKGGMRFQSSFSTSALLPLCARSFFLVGRSCAF